MKGIPHQTELRCITAIRQRGCLPTNDKSRDFWPLLPHFRVRHGTILGNMARHIIGYQHSADALELVTNPVWNCSYQSNTRYIYMISLTCELRHSWKGVLLYQNHMALAGVFSASTHCYVLSFSSKRNKVLDSIHCIRKLACFFQSSYSATTPLLHIINSLPK